MDAVIWFTYSLAFDNGYTSLITPFGPLLWKIQGPRDFIYEQEYEQILLAFLTYSNESNLIVYIRVINLHTNI
jgi:hypothetical protein